jgi:hypothetical protein
MKYTLKIELKIEGEKETETLSQEFTDNDLDIVFTKAQDELDDYKAMLEDRQEKEKENLPF